jgi:transposase
MLFVQAAHIVLVRRPHGARLSLWPWIETAGRRLHRNMLVIALANKLARIAWAVLARGHAYQPRSASYAVLGESASGSFCNRSALRRQR